MQGPSQRSVPLPGLLLGVGVALSAAVACGGVEAAPDGGAPSDASLADAPKATEGSRPEDGSKPVEGSKPKHRPEPIDASRPTDAPRRDGHAIVRDGASPSDVQVIASDGPPVDGHAGPSGFPYGLHVVNGSGGSPGHIVDGLNQVAAFHGVDRSGTEFACTYEAGGDAGAGFPGFFDGPNDQAAVTAMASWHINAVRVPLNEDCWLGINGLPMNDTSADYQAAIVAWVRLLNANGMAAVVDLHWAAPGTEATNSDIGQLPMADADHAPAFWTSVATTFAGNSAVILDLFNEPYITDWGCWVSGDTASGACAVDTSNTPYAVAGMATLLQAVRMAGAENVVILGGLSYSGDFTSWVSSVNSIPMLPAPLDGISLDNVAASWHVYDFGSDSTGCPSQYNGYSGTCYTAAATATNTSVTTVLAAGFPVLTGEVGISAFSTASAAMFSPTQVTDLVTWLDGMLTWTEGQGQGYIAWSWNTDTDPVLLTDYTPTPSPDFGVTYEAHLAGF